MPARRAHYPLATADGLTGNKHEMREDNERRIREYLLSIVPPPPRVSRAHHLNHHPTRPQLVTGQRNRRDTGAWMQLCSKDARTGSPLCTIPKFLTDGLPEAQLQKNPLAKYLAIRQELAVIHRGTSHPYNMKTRTHLTSSHKARPTSPPVRSNASSVGSNASSASTRPNRPHSNARPAPEARRRVSSPEIIDLTGDDSDDDSGCVSGTDEVTIMVWTNNSLQPVHFLVPRRAGRVRLADHKILLGAKGVEKTLLQHYCSARNRWLPMDWATPIPVAKNGLALFREQGLSEFQMMGLEKHRLYL
ncbi:hypothetical protein CPB85DRAFT_1438155 [Mucidula mucida]|nr:hypothetical protein CPB85DRAFT_1438155 [Mucidula mucida]